MTFRPMTDRPTRVLRQAAVRPLAWRGNTQPALRWAAWAESLLRRHARGTAAWYSLSAVLRQSTPGVHTTWVDRRSSLTFGLRLSIPVVQVMVVPLTPTTLRSPAARRDAGTPLPGVLREGSVERVTLLTRRAQNEQHYHEAPSPLALLRRSDVRIVHAQALAAVERIYARQGKVFEAWGAAPPVVTQVVRPPETPPTAPPSPASPFAPDTAITPLRHWNDAAPQPQIPMDMSRLTDQVIQSIDQRLVASRERFGRR